MPEEGSRRQWKGMAGVSNGVGKQGKQQQQQLVVKSKADKHQSQS
jgi:hypothetical protein